MKCSRKHTATMLCQMHAFMSGIIASKLTRTVQLRIALDAEVHQHGKRFEDVNDLPIAVRKAIRLIPQADYKNCFKSWVNRWQRCVECSGVYFEKM